MAPEVELGLFWVTFKSNRGRWLASAQQREYCVLRAERVWRIEDTGAGLVYLYDLAGRRISSVTTTGSDNVHEVYAGSGLVAAHTPGPFGGTTYFYHSDQLGTDRVVTGSARAVIETCTSLPGACPERSRRGDNHSCTSNVPARFEGYDTDQEYGLAHAPARYYSPSLGRFMTPDPFGTPPEKQATCSLGGPPKDEMTGTLARPESLNRYAYVSNRTTTSTDPSGGLEQQPAGPLPDSGVGGFYCDPTHVFCVLASILGGASGGVSNFSACQCGLISLDFPDTQLFGCGPYICTCDDGEAGFLLVPPRLKPKCLFRICPVYLTVVKPVGADITWANITGSFPSLCN
ncbi:MAG TPA: RHS repeat-associated core domain-containing protein [Candidatus Acidoferrales bacterium]|nr:RHS repeat-associated core domain-containing protein [Candidatus Acidoferrales bacterium]